MDRRTFLQITGLSALSVMAAGCGEPDPSQELMSTTAETPSAPGTGAPVGPPDFYTLPKLPYAYDALEPVIDARTMQLHHDIHHAGYVKGLNAALAQLAGLRHLDDEAAMQAQIKQLSRELAFHGSGHFLHTIFWQNMAPLNQGGVGQPTGVLADALVRSFGTLAAFKAQFCAAAKAVEGSGWALLVQQPDGALEVLEAELHQNLTQHGVRPLLVVDVWEHAYYLNYQNRRAAYVDAWWNLVNWNDVAARYTI